MSVSVVIPSVFWLIQLVFVPLFIKAGWPESTKKGFYFKMVCATAYVGFGFYCAYINGKVDSYYPHYMLIGLVLGWVGDFCLTFDPFLVNKPKAVTSVVYIFGGVSFLAGHIFYIVAFLHLFNQSGKSLDYSYFAMIAALFCIMVLLKCCLKVRLGKLSIPVAVYALMILAMLVSAVFAGFMGGRSIGFSSVAVAGAALFVISDFSLALKMFAEDRFNTLAVRILYIITYFLAQMLIASTLVLV